MTQTLSPATDRSARLRLAIPALVLAVVAFAGGRLSAGGPEATWADGAADVVEQKVTIESGGWTFGFEGSLWWVDASGRRHEDGFPECLAGDGSHPVRFAWAAVDGRRTVTAVDCRG
jgi:hypothetical protein